MTIEGALQCIVCGNRDVRFIEVEEDGPLYCDECGDEFEPLVNGQQLCDICHATEVNAGEIW